MSAHCQFSGFVAAIYGAEYGCCFATTRQGLTDATEVFSFEAKTSDSLFCWPLFAWVKVLVTAMEQKS
jgi:hypothetical protein